MSTPAPSPTASGLPQEQSPGGALQNQGIGLQAFLTSLGTAVAVFAVQTAIFLVLRNQLPRIFRPKTYMVPERERTEPPPVSPWNLLDSLLRFKDREIIKKSGLDAYFFLRYLQTMLVVFIPIACIIMPILIPINYVGGISQDIQVDDNLSDNLAGLETIAWGNVRPSNYRRRWSHLVCALVVIVWVCAVCFYEFRVYVKIRQDYLTSAEHRLRASANTVLVSGIPKKWLTEEALRGLFDVFPGGIRNIWITRDFTKLLDKIRQRDEIHSMLEAAQTDLIRQAKRKQLKMKKKEDEKERKAQKAKSQTRAERRASRHAFDAEAKRMAESNAGVSAGDHDEVPEVDVVVDETRQEEAENRADKAEEAMRSRATDAGRAKKAAAKVAFEEEDRQPSSERSTSTEKLRTAERPHTADSTYTGTASAGTRPSFEPGHLANTTRKVKDWDNLLGTEESKWWQFWKPPSGAYASPIPQGYEGDEFPLRPTEKVEKKVKTFGARVKGIVPFLGNKEQEEPVEYPVTFDFDAKNYVEDEEGAAWARYLKKSDRPTHRLRLFQWTPSFLPSIPFATPKVDTIYWCRKELARLNMEIEEDQEHPERYPAMNSAFIQFNHQVAAHMACQSVAHHVPKQMAPRMVEVSPEDVIWENMAITWLGSWVRTFAGIGIIFGMIILWTFPVAFISSISQIDSLIKTLPWLGFLNSTETIRNAVNAVAGVLPAALLALLLLLVPFIMGLIATYQGAKTGAQRSEFVQIYYFAFLFVQVFLVLSIAGGVTKTLSDSLKDVQGIPQLLAQNLPAAANFFFSYMILQAMSTSAGTLLQIGTLIVWFFLARLLDNTARSKWRRQTSLNTINWGGFYPVYTNFACIGIIYCVVAPLISIFAIITFGLLWFAHRYNMVYVVRFKIDTGGVLYPRALNQTFTGLYFMELCLIGLFFLVTDEQGNFACKVQGIIMIVALILTILYQYLLNASFGPVLRYLPITFEDEAVLRDEAFQRAQDRRLGILRDDEDEAVGMMSRTDTNGDDVELKPLGQDGRRTTTGGGVLGNLKKPVKGIVGAGTWAFHTSKRARKATFGKAEENLKTAAEYRRERRRKDLESQRATGEALYGGYHDEIEDLTPEERNALVRQAFKHSALRARRPVVWIPRDDLGISEDEILRTRRISEQYLWISNEGTALDSKVRVVYGQSPPDFASTELINL